METLGLKSLFNLLLSVKLNPHECHNRMPTTCIWLLHNCVYHHVHVQICASWILLLYVWLYTYVINMNISVPHCGGTAFLGIRIHYLCDLCWFMIPVAECCLTCDTLAHILSCWTLWANISLSCNNSMKKWWRATWVDIWPGVQYFRIGVACIW